MAETEVASILREIRERVITQERAARSVKVSAAAGTAGVNGPADPQAAAAGRLETAENLALIDSHLTTTARAWDRLPPLVSNRSGLVASLELWCKRLVKRATRWYSWEQVNFNAAVHHALRDLLQVLAAYEHELEKLREENIAAAEARRLEGEQYRSELAARGAETRAALQTQSDVNSTQNSQLERQLKGLTSELREREEHLRAEQSVCFRQLSLETAEAATLVDRTRRKTEALLAELQRRIEQLEGK
jgi:hypothetical protein